jgi:hypothetical protein
MATVAFGAPEINPGRPVRRPYARTKSPDPHRLEGRDRRAWEESIFATPGLKGSRLHLARVLLEEFCWGKCYCFPGDELLAKKCGLGTATIGRCLRDLVGLGVIRIVKDRGRRRIVFPSHPHAAAFLAGLEPASEPAEAPAPIVPEPVAEPADHPVGPADHRVAAADQTEGPIHQNDGRSVLVEARDEAHHKPAPPCAREGEPEGSLSDPNEPTNGESPRSMPAPMPRPAGMMSRRLAGIPDLAGAPVDDPVIAAELGRRACARKSAVAIPSRDEVLAAVLGAAAGDVLEADPGAGPEVHHGANADVHDAASTVDPEAATIEALSKLGPGATRGEVLSATLRLAALFRDLGSRAFYRSVCSEVARGQLPARIPIAAVGSARGPGIRNPGAAFTAHIKRARAAAEVRRPMRA